MLVSKKKKEWNFHPEIWRKMIQFDLLIFFQSLTPQVDIDWVFRVGVWGRPHHPMTP